jgi:hypothetical protein
LNWNDIMRETNSTLTAERARELLDYNPLTGSLTWRERRSWKALKGSAAGTAKPGGYRVVGIDGVLYYAHRLVFLMVEGAWPAAHVDHINHIRNDNRWANLRVVTVSENQQNRVLTKRNTTGVEGVTWCKTRRKWRATVALHGVQVFHKRFDDLELAIAARKTAAAKHHTHD